MGCESELESNLVLVPSLNCLELIGFIGYTEELGHGTLSRCSLMFNEGPESLTQCRDE